MVMAAGLGGEAGASAGFGCDAKDGKASFLFEAGVTRGMGFPVFNFKGKASVKTKIVAADLRTMTFDGAHLAQYWAEDGQLNLVIYREREGSGPHGYMQIIIRTRLNADDMLVGSYDLEAMDMTGVTSGEGKTFKAKGKVECMFG